MKCVSDIMLNIVDVIPKRKCITFFKLGKLWVFKQFFDNRALFDALLNYYNKDLFRFESKSTGARNNALKLLERNGFDTTRWRTWRTKWSSSQVKYAPILKNSVAFKETANERIFLMKDLATVEEAAGLGAKIHEGTVSFWAYAKLNSFSLWMACILLAAFLFFCSS